MVSPTLTCHQISGSTGNCRAGTKTAPTSSEESTTGKEKIRRSACHVADPPTRRDDGAERSTPAPCPRASAAAVRLIAMSDWLTIRKPLCPCRKTSQAPSWTPKAVFGTMPVSRDVQTFQGPRRVFGSWEPLASTLHPVSISGRHMIGPIGGNFSDRSRGESSSRCWIPS